MPRANVHIRNENAKVWGMIDNKSEWVNAQLARVRTKNTAEPAPVAGVEVITKFEQGKPDEIISIDGVKPEIIKTPQEAQKATQAISDTARSVCPNGHILAPGTKRCSWKGCKYSK